MSGREPTSYTEIANSLYGEPKVQNQRITFEEPPKGDADLLFDRMTDYTNDELGPYVSAFKEGLDRLAHTNAWSDQDRRDAFKEHAEAFQLLNVDPGDASRLHQIVTRYVMRPATDEEATTWKRDVGENLRMVYGADFDTRIAVANAYVQRHPKLNQVLESTGLGSHPEIVQRVVDTAWRKRKNN